MTIVSAEDLVKKIKQVQKNQGYTDQQMADILGCSRITYLNVRTGKKRPGNAFFTGALKYLSSLIGGTRSAVIKRDTSETTITVELNVDGTGKYEINTGIKMLDHLLSQVAKHGKLDLKITAAGNDHHHITEDVAICLGQAFGKAMGDKHGIVRMADAIVPMDDALASVIIDISGRGYTHLDMAFSHNDMLGFSTDLVRHFLESLAIEARLNLHARVLYGINDHHKAEALFKALGLALDKAARIDERISGELPSTKNFIES